MDARSHGAPPFRLWRVLECLVVVAGAAGLSLYTVSCQSPFSWSAVVGPQHWMKIDAGDGQMDLLLMTVRTPSCLEPLAGRWAALGSSVFTDDGYCGSWHSSSRPAVVKVFTPDWLYDACDSSHKPIATMILRLPIAPTTFAVLLIPVVVRGWRAGRKLLRSAGYRCAECGYPLQGLPVLRCPECGQR
jgi:hypothetical protein